MEIETKLYFEGFCRLLHSVARFFLRAFRCSVSEKPITGLGVCVRHGRYCPADCGFRIAFEHYQRCYSADGAERYRRCAGYVGRGGDGADYGSGRNDSEHHDVFDWRDPATDGCAEIVAAARFGCCGGFVDDEVGGCNAAEKGFE